MWASGCCFFISPCNLSRLCLSGLQWSTSLRCSCPSSLLSPAALPCGFLHLGGRRGADREVPQNQLQVHHRRQGESAFDFTSGNGSEVAQKLTYGGVLRSVINKTSAIPPSSGETKDCKTVRSSKFCFKCRSWAVSSTDLFSLVNILCLTSVMMLVQRWFSLTLLKHACPHIHPSIYRVNSLNSYGVPSVVWFTNMWLLWLLWASSCN